MRIFKKFLANLIPTPKTDQVAFFVDSNDGKLTRKESNGSLAKYVPESGKKVYKALLMQSGTSAPTAIVLENTLGVTVSFTREFAGQYVVYPSFPGNKPYVSYTRRPGMGSKSVAFYAYEDGVVIIHSYNEANTALSDNMLSDEDQYNKTSITIEVYP